MPQSPLPLEVRGAARQPLGMSPATFLRDYWQKHPLLIRHAFPGFVPPLQPEDLAGLACEDGVLSRLIRHDEERSDWQVKNGPLSEGDFASTGDANWTLLVQDVDKWDVDVAELLEHFRFLPSWRVDDIMISYAEAGGGVGAHVDQYDVFLIQGLGLRHWAICDDPAAPKDFRPDVPLKQLVQFEATHEWLLEPGDMLYLPPNMPHHGVAFGGPCMTLSVGMRAPSQAELTGDLADYLTERLSEEQRYADPDLRPAKHPGKIDRAALDRLRDSSPVTSALDDATLKDWFGRFITKYRMAQHPAVPTRPLTAKALRKKLDEGHKLLRHPWARLAWAPQGRQARLFGNGEAWPASAALAEKLCAQPKLEAHDITADDFDALLALINAGLLVPHKPRNR